VGGSRSDLYRVAWDEFRSAPLAGDGAGAFPLRWLRDRRTPQPVQNAHSLPLDVLASTGLVGLLLLGTTIGAIAVGAARARLRPSVLSRSLAAGATATVATFLVSCAIDWTWQIGALTAAALLLAAPLLVDGRVRAPR
jgi:O-antigen ligase